MKKSVLIAIFLILSGANLIFAEKPPIESGGWYYEGGTTLNGKRFYDVADAYREQDGWAVVEGIKIHYWLYDTYTYHKGLERAHAVLAINNKFVPKWVERMGYVIDFDNVNYIEQNDALAQSVRALMQQRKCDVSVALIRLSNKPKGYSAYVVINWYDKDLNLYFSLIYYLY